jgi:hypothetical protein
MGKYLIEISRFNFSIGLPEIRIIRFFLNASVDANVLYKKYKPKSITDRSSDLGIILVFRLPGLPVAAFA